MFVVDAFVVNVAIPSIRASLSLSEAQIEAVIVVYQVAFATLVITGGGLGDLHGRRSVFLVGLLGFTAASLWCGAAGRAPSLSPPAGAGRGGGADDVSDKEAIFPPPGITSADDPSARASMSSATVPAPDHVIEQPP